MTRRRKWLCGAAVLALLAGAATVYFVWGALLEAEYERRVDALRESGDYADAPATWDPGVPPETNAAGPLREAAALLERLKEEDEEFADAYDNSKLFMDGGEEAREEGKKELRPVWPRLDAYFAKLEEACGRPVFVPPPLTQNPDGHPLWCGVQDHTEMWTLWSKLAPEQAPRIVQQMLDLAERFRPTGSFEVSVRDIVRSEGLGILHAGLARGTLDPAPQRPRWDRQLAAVDSIGDLRLHQRLARIETVRFFETFRRGEDPLAEARKTMQETRELLEGVDVPDFLPEVPDTAWLATWYGRPAMHRWALEELDAADHAAQQVWDEASLREALAASPRHARDLEKIAVLRLARLAMRIREDAKARGAARDRLEDYAAIWDGPLPLDPFTGQAFVYERHADRVVLASAIVVPTAEVPASLGERVVGRLLDEDLLRWEVRWAPRKQGD